jgi:hypothetical protein
LSSLTHRAVPLLLLALAPQVALAQVPPPPAPPAAPAAPPAATAKTYLAAGEKAAKAKDWSTALAQFTAANAAEPSAAALLGVAHSQYNLKMQPEAYDSYEQLLRSYATTIPRRDKQLAEQRIKELGEVTGYVSIRVNETGANVSIDGKSVGTSPVAALIRVTTGPHKIDVTKDGFNPVTMTPNVGANGKEIVDVQLQHAATTGRISVKESANANVRVIVDGADVGAAPMDIEVAPGPHEVSVRSATMASPAQKIEVERGKTSEVTLTAIAASAHLEVTTSDRQGIIFLDNKPVAEGAYTGDVPPGEHLVSVTRDGFERYDKKVDLQDKQTVVETVTLKHLQAQTTGPIVHEHVFDGLYGGIGVLGLMEPAGNNNEFEQRCSQLGASSCSTPPPIGGGLMGWVGWAWHPIGIEAFFAGELDETTPSATFTATPNATTNPLNVGVPRVEQYSIIRVGGVGAARMRLSFQSERVRFSFAPGFGLALKEMELIRRAEGNDQTKNAYSGGFQSYVSPALILDMSVALRMGDTTALAFGMLGWLETAGADGIGSPAQNTTGCGSDGQTCLGKATPPTEHPIATPAYRYAQTTQVFIGPYIGLQFGP